MPVTSSKSSTATPPLTTGWGRAVLSVVLFWIVAVALQHHNGAYIADIGADPDEPAHAVTSLMVRDYLAAGLPEGEGPMAFAQRYYDHFPKVALGHYPPGFYLLAGLWMLPRATPEVLLIFVALLAAVFAAVSAAAALRCGLSKGAAGVVGIWTLVLPITQNLTALIMSDFLLATLCLLSALAFASFLNRQTVGSSLAFGTFAAAAILTKAAGFALALVPPLSILLLRRWSMLKDWRLWIAPLPVVLTALPWTLKTMGITERGMQSKTTAEYLPEAVAFFADAARYSFGWIILAAALFSVLRSLPRLVKNDDSTDSTAIVLASFTIALLALYVSLPTGLSSRYLLPIVPGVLIAAAFALREGRRLWVHPLSADLFVGIGAAASFIFIFPEHKKVADGFGDMAAELAHTASGGKVLVSSDARGEGSLIAELAFRIKDRAHSPWTVVRASKFMASSDWSGRGYATAFTSRDEFLEAMKREGIRWIVQDRGIPRPYRFQHHQQIDDWCAGMKPVKVGSGRREFIEESSEIVLLETGLNSPAGSSARP